MIEFSLIVLLWNLERTISIYEGFASCRNCYLSLVTRNLVLSQNIGTIASLSGTILSSIVSRLLSVKTWLYLLFASALWMFYVNPMILVWNVSWKHKCHERDCRIKYYVMLLYLLFRIFACLWIKILLQLLMNSF